jgi:hypothetical protein
MRRRGLEGESVIEVGWFWRNWFFYIFFLLCYPELAYSKPFFHSIVQELSVFLFLFHLCVCPSSHIAVSPV